MKHKLDASVGYHKYLGKDLLNLKSDHKADIPGEPELTFQRAPLIIDDKSRVAREEEPLKGEWKGAPDLYPGSLVPTATRHSIEAAAFWSIALERCCQQQLLVQATGVTPKLIPDDRSRYSREHVGSEYIGWLHFQTIWNDLVRSEPDLFD